MNIVSNTLLGIGLVMLTAYLVIGLVNHVGFIHRPFLLFIGGVVLVLAGLVGRYVLPKLYPARLPRHESRPVMEMS